MRRLRRVVVGLIIASLGIAALGGIVVLLSGTASETGFRVLGTTALTGAFSVAALCGIALVGRRGQWFGWVTVAVAAASLGHLLWLLWAEPRMSETVVQLAVTGCILTVTTAIGSLLLLLAAHGRALVRALLVVVLTLVGIGAGLALLPVWELLGQSGDAFWRFAGAMWILAALGIVVLPVVALFLRDTDQSAGTPRPAEAAVAAAPQAVPAELSPVTTQRLVDAARSDQ